MTGVIGNIYLMGDTFLRNYYAVFDSENNEIGLGINIHSKGTIQMYDSPKEILNDEEFLIDEK